MFDNKKFSRNIKAIATSGTKLAALIHETGCMALARFGEVGADGNPIQDARPLDTLYKALPSGYNAKGFRVWVSTFSPIRWNGDGKVGVLPKDAKTYVELDVVNATANPFWTLDAVIKDQSVRELTAEALRAMIDRYVTLLNSADVNTGEIKNDDGKVTAKVAGNVVSLQAYAAKIKAAADEVPAKPAGELIRDGVVIGAA